MNQPGPYWGPHWKPLDRVARRVWNRLPESLLTTHVFRVLGHQIHKRVSAYQGRAQTPWTRFMRNKPLLELIANIVRNEVAATPVKIASIGCSLGAELYSLLYLIRLGPDVIRIEATGADISSEIVAQAEGGRFRRDASELAGLSDHEITEMFVVQNDSLDVRDRIREGTRWIIVDARHPKFTEILGRQDVVLANNFLGPMLDAEAESCFGNIMEVTKPGGYLVIDGINLDLKTRLVSRYGLKPIPTRVDEIHRADVTKQDWPWVRWALEPIDRERSDWQERYSAVFQIP